jgi:hypothetical protein
MTRDQLIKRAGALALAVFLVTAERLPGQATATASEETVAQVLSDLRFLADDARDGRGVGTEGLEEAAAYLAKRFEEIGLQPAGTDGYFQQWQLDPTAPALAHGGLGEASIRNVIGILPGHGKLAGQVVVLGAHYDHLGMGIGPYAGFSTDSMPEDKVHNGADDNASGTSALLLAAQLLANREAPSQRTFVFLAFTAEELGTIGSQYYAANPVLPHDSAAVMLNFDMVGRLRGDSLVIGGTGSAPQIPELLDRVNEDYGFEIGKQEDPWGSSDHYVFYGQGMPVMHFYTNVHPDYHNPGDDWEKINAAGIVRVTEFAVDIAWELAKGEARLTYASVPKPPSRGRRASLGTVPDMMGSPGGLRLQAVRPGTAAEEAGLRASDIIVQIGEVQVKDLNGLQEALTTYKRGETVTIIFLREGERMETEATLK